MDDVVSIMPAAFTSQNILLVPIMGWINMRAQVCGKKILTMCDMDSVKIITISKQIVRIWTLNIVIQHTHTPQHTGQARIMTATYSYSRSLMYAVNNFIHF